MSNLITAIDFGSSKIAVAVGEMTTSGIRIRSYYDAPSAGIKGGEIINDLKVIDALKPLLCKAEEECGEPIKSAVISLSGKLMHAEEISCRSQRRDSDKYITEEEIRLISAKQFEREMPGDEMIFDVIPQRFNVDDQCGLRMKDVIGMSGETLECFFKVFSGKSSLFNKRKKILNECGMYVKKVILSHIASSASVLTRQEMENGVALVDIGKNLTDIAIVKDNIVRDIYTVPFGGDAVTNDIKTVTNLTYEWSENIKQRFGNCLEEYTAENKQLVLRGEDNVEDGTVELSLLSRVIEARMSEIFDAVDYVIKQSGYAAKLPSGVVLTGGCSYMEHITQLARILLDKKVRLAAPRSSITPDSAIGAMDAFSSTAVGLVIEALSGNLSFATDIPALRKAGSFPKSDNDAGKQTVRTGNIFDEEVKADQEKTKSEKTKPEKDEKKPEVISRPNTVAQQDTHDIPTQKGGQEQEEEEEIIDVVDKDEKDKGNANGGKKGGGFLRRFIDEFFAEDKDKA